MNELVLQALRSYPKIQIIEAYTGKHLTFAEPRLLDTLELSRFAEVKFRPNEMPELYYETDNSLKVVRLSCHAIAPLD